MRKRCRKRYGATIGKRYICCTKRFERRLYAPWELIYDDSTECFRIQNKNTGLYLTAPSTATEGGAITEAAYTGSSSQLWVFSTTSNGYYIIQSLNRDGTNIVLALSDMMTLQQVTYENDEDLLDEWEFYPFEGWVKLNVLQDNAYTQRFSYSSLRIAEQLAILQDKFLTEFGIYVEYGSVTDYASYPEQSTTNCPNNCDELYDELCLYPDADTCRNSYLSILESSPTLRLHHHKNITSMLYRLPLPDTTKSLTIAFTGHRNCAIVEYSDGTTKHEDSPYWGIACPRLGIMMVMNFSSDEGELITTVHEFGHMVGAEDHYGLGVAETTQEIIARTGNYEYNAACIYGEGKSTSAVKENLTICKGCQASIRANVQMYWHEN